jgi:uncharacterized membrane protein
MNLLITGLAIFMGAHLLPTVPAARNALLARLGEKTYKIVFSLVSLAGFALLVMGKARAPFVPVYTPASWGHVATAAFMLPALVLLPAAHMPGNIKRFTRHPMNWAVVIWASGHLLANGDQASIILFASFGLYAVYDMWSANRRGATRQVERLPLKKDAVILIAGVLTYGVVRALHLYLFGVPVS